MASDSLATLFLHQCIRTSIKRPLSIQHRRTSKRTFTTSSPYLHSNSARHRRKLALPQAPSFANKQPTGPKHTHVIFNPPPSMPNIYHTPLKFLPPHDPRRALYTNAALPSMYNLPSQSPSDTGRYSDTSRNLTATPIAKPGTALHDLGSTFPSSMAPILPPSAPLPPPVPRQWILSEQKQLTQEEVDEIRRLRNEDSQLWTVSKLQRKFNCAAQLIKAIAAPTEAHERHVKREEETREKWSFGRQKTWREREVRKELWRRDMADVNDFPDFVREVQPETVRTSTIREARHKYDVGFAKRELAKRRGMGDRTKVNVV